MTKRGKTVLYMYIQTCQQRPPSGKYIHVIGLC